MSKINVLLVDDDKSICDSLSRMLIKKGYSVDSRNSGTEALEALRNSSYDILMTDLKMPGMSGIELLREAKKISADIGVIIMTGFGEITSYIEAMELGAAEYLNKPVKGDDLEIIIENLVKKRKKKNSAEPSAHCRQEPAP